jgi:hypothetical protein
MYEGEVIGVASVCVRVCVCVCVLKYHKLTSRFWFQ